MLDEIGLVHTEKNRGVFVRDMSLREAAEIFDVRAALEELVGRQLATRITPAQLQEINLLLDAMTQAVAAQDANQYHLLNLQFHDRLVELTGNRRLQGLYRKLTKELTLFRRRSLGGSGVLPLSEQGHRQIVAAIASGNPEAAGRAMAEHVLGSKQRSVGDLPAEGHTTATVPGNTETNPY
jgi:DNA-binding GntR family transcriptional regulator